MHEGHFTEQIVEAILQGLSEKSVVNPSRVKVRVGEMLHLEAESVLMHFRAITARTCLEKTELELESVPVLVRCRQCGEEGGVSDHHFLMCETCESREVELIEGGDVVIEEITGEQG